MVFVRDAELRRQALQPCRVSLQRFQDVAVTEVQPGESDVGGVIEDIRIDPRGFERANCVGHRRRVIGHAHSASSSRWLRRFLQIHARVVPPIFSFCFNATPG